MKIKIYTIALIALVFAACEKYEDFTNDYEYSNVYFAYQNPVRTVLTDDLSFKVGVVMGGKRTNNVDEQVTFELAPELLNDPDIVGDNNFTMLPSNYYTLSSANNITIERGEIVGFVTVDLNRELFLADSLCLDKNYALPFLIKETTLDSILVGSEELSIPRKDYSIVVVKYHHKTHGVYYHRGNRTQYKADGSTIDTVISYIPAGHNIYEPDIAWKIQTNDANSLHTNGIAEFPKNGDDNDYSLKINHPENDQISIEAGMNSVITGVTDLGSSYDSENKVYYLNYQYTIDNIKNVMNDTLSFRDDMLSLELW
ncbi:DUF1735 domain-containing protein [Maribellus sediminis]|uniref:DUF1735 domain-containing protein n=1 Tax=Maribellus sediminis TaxID=2696285 RepID=UPI0014313535|nr:DUF1735 domain-containing protein [Maribellus sediminis]